MNLRITAIGIGLGAGLYAVSAAAQPALSAPPPPAPSSDADEAEDTQDLDPAKNADELTTKGQELEDKIASMQSNKAQFPIKVSGYGDLGAFSVQGDGTGFRRDTGHNMFPNDANYGWVFYGDLLATQVNSRGDVADLGQAPGVERFDSIHSGGKLTFLVNELNLSVQAGLGPSALLTTTVNFTPRS